MAIAKTYVIKWLKKIAVFLSGISLLVLIDQFVGPIESIIAYPSMLIIAAYSIFFVCEVNSKVKIIAFTVSVFAILFALTVWPTRYRYDHTSAFGNHNVLTKIDRINGETYLLNPQSGWLKR